MRKDNELFPKRLFCSMPNFSYFDLKAVQILKEEKKVTTHRKNVHNNKLICHMN